MSRLRKGFFASAFLGAACVAASASPQKLEDFARRPQMHGPAISADGRYLAFLTGSGDDTVLMIFDRNQAGSEFKRVTASEPNKFDIGWCRWATQQRVLCGLFGNIRGKKYAEPPFKRLFAVNADGSALKALEEARDDANPLQPKTSARNFNMNLGAAMEHSNMSNYAMAQNTDVFGTPGAANSFVSQFNAERQDEVIDFTPGDADTVLVQADDDNDGYPSVVLLNINNAHRTVKMMQNPPIQVFVTDGHGNPRLGWGVTRTGETNYFALLDGEREWRPLSVTVNGANNRLRPIAMGAQPNTAYAFGLYEGRDALWSLDLTDKQPPKLLFKHPLVVVGEPILSADRHLLGVRYDVERPYVWYANPAHRELIDKLERQFPNRVFDIIDSSEDQKVLVVQASSDVDLGTYYLYDVENSKLQKLGTAYPELDQLSLGVMNNVTYKAADGTEIPGYLTVPNNVPKKNLPLIVMPHDGPGARDSWKFDFLRNFLANRGYAVLQMNYRGSAGLGDKWRAAAMGDVAGAAYSDIQDATQWAISQGIADPKRVCIVGWGFGGYEAMLSAARNSGTYQCAISIGGIADLALQRQHGAALGATPNRDLGDKEKADKDSPLANADKVNIPVLLVHGTKDWQVQMDHTQKLQDALEKRKKDVSVVLIKNGTHELDRKSDRVTLLTEVESFLQQHIGTAATH